MGKKVHADAAVGCAAQEVLDPRVRRTRQLLAEALRSLLREKRLSAVSVQDIAERATVNRATFYAHYTDKEDLAASLLRADLHAALMRRFSRFPSLTADDLTEMAVAVFEFLGEMRSHCPEGAAELQSVAAGALQDGLYEVMEGWLSRSSEYKRLFPGCSKETVATVLSWSIYGGAVRWSDSPRRAPAPQVCREIVSVLLPLRP